MTPEEFEAWLQEDPHPDWLPVYKKGHETNAREIYHRTNMGLLYDCLDAAKDPRGQRTFTMKVKGDMGAVTHVIGYTISDVVIEQPCPGEHTFNEWQYDFTGGDIRTCQVCGLIEQT